MTITVNGTLVKTQFNDSSLTVTNGEVIADNAINTLNIFLHTALSNLSGAAGSKSGSYTSAQAGAILAVALQVYREMYKNAPGNTNVAVSALGTSYIASTQLLNFAEKIARQLNRATEDAPLYVSNDPVPTE